MEKFRFEKCGQKGPKMRFFKVLLKIKTWNFFIFLIIPKFKEGGGDDFTDN